MAGGTIDLGIGHQGPAISLKISGLSLPVEESEEHLPKHLAERVGVSLPDVLRFRILKKSLDARSRTDLRFVYTAVVDLPSDAAETVAASHYPARPFVPDPFDDPVPGTLPAEHRPVIIGSGPAGLLAGYYLARKGYRPLILERGEAVKHRVPAIRKFDRGGEFDRENNYLFGEGGAGCFSDGKLTCRMEGSDVDWVLERFVECGGRPSIVYENRPHLGSNKLPMICRNFRRKIEAFGGEYRFGCCVDDFDLRDGRVFGLHTSGGYIATRHVVLAIGHSARDTYQTLHDRGVPMESKAFQLGLRIEQPQSQINDRKYGRERYLQVLGAADYTLQARGTRDVFTFCMCAGGLIIPSVSEPGAFCTNGMSNSRHDTPHANSGVVVTLEPKEFGSNHPLAGVELQRTYERLAYEVGRGNYLCPVQRATDFLAGKPVDPQERIDCSYQRGSQAADLAALLPEPIAKAIRTGLPLMDRKFDGMLLKNAVLVGPEMRGSSPVRISRDRISRQSPTLHGLYPVGEGAGFAGGIVSAAVDGLRTAREIVRAFAPVG